MFVVFVYSNSADDQFRSLLRCRNTADALQRTGYHTARLLGLDDFIRSTPTAAQLCKQADLLVIHRHLYGAVLKSVLLWKALGKKVLVDFDESPNLLAGGMNGHAFWHGGIPNPTRCEPVVFNTMPVQPVPFEQFRLGLKVIDGAVVPSARLADDWSAVVRTIYLPDFVNTDHYLAPTPIHTEKIRIGVIGCGLEFSTIRSSGLLAALEEVCRCRPSVEVCFFDIDDDTLAATSISAARRVVYRNIPVRQWPTILSTLDIGVAPVDGKASLRASRLPAVELSILRIPWLASSLPPYRELQRYGWLINNEPSHWERGILEIVDHLNVYKEEAAGEPYLFGISQDVFENVEKIITAYSSVIEG